MFDKVLWILNTDFRKLFKRAAPTCSRCIRLSFWDFVHLGYMKHATVRGFGFLMLKDLRLFSQVGYTYLEYVASVEIPLIIFRKYNFLTTLHPVNIC